MTPGPTISVIVNTCDRSASLRTLLHSLNHQTYADFEVVVVVGPTADDTLEMLDSELGERVVVVRCGDFNLSCSRNAGLAAAAGEVAAFIDDDAIPSPGWLEHLAAAYADPSVAGAGGRTYLLRPDSGEVQFLYGLVSPLAQQQDVRWDPSEPPPLSGNGSVPWFPRFHGTNMSYRTAALRAVGGFDQRFEYLFDDADIGVRLGRAGHYLHQSGQAIVYHIGATGRNRGRELYDLNWYSWLRSTLYFTLKNGAGARARDVNKALIAHIKFFYSGVASLHRRGEMSDRLYRSARRQLYRACRDGLAQGLLGRRRIPGLLESTGRALVPFLRPESPRFPSIPPTGAPRREGLQPASEAPLRICLLSVGYPPASTHGVARSTQTLAIGLAALGHEVHVVTSGPRHLVRFADGAYVWHVPPVDRPGYRLLPADYPNLACWLAHSHACFEAVQALIANHRIQVVDSPLWNLDGLVTAVAGTVPVAVRVMTAMRQIAAVHGRDSAENQLLGDLETRFLEMAGLVVANSEASVRALRDVYGLDLDRHPHLLALYGMVPSPEPPEPAPKPAGEATILFVGRLEKRKGVVDLLAAIPAVLARHPKARFLLAGGDNSVEDGFAAATGASYAADFRRRHRGLERQVEFLGHVDETRLQELYRDCDLLVAPSLYESFGLIFLEAMDQAKPVIGCDVGGPAEIIVDQETGLLVPAAAPERLAAAIARLVAEPGTRRRMGQAGRRRLLERFTHLTMAEAFVAGYRDLIARSSTAPANLPEPQP